MPDMKRSHASSFNFPEGYPDYFDADGAIKCEYLTDLAEKIAQRLGQDKLTMHQLRAFYGHVRRQQAALKAGRPFKEVSSEICKLKPFARERAEKRKVPNFFEEFIRRNVDKAQDQRSFSWGFLEHFQAVVAYCSGTIRER
jgi:CRISPR/Cas system CSM-associated protein Csm2 small subunit